MNYWHKFIIIILFLIFTGVGCSPEENNNYPGFTIPQGFPQPVYDPIDNGMTPKGYALGKKLFFDPILSRDNTISCGDCHKQWSAFADGAHPLSHGIDNLFGIRNTPPIFNLAWMPYFMWDGGINHIEVMPIDPITNPVEMDETLANVIDKLNNHPEYPELFADVFGISPINSQQMLTSMAWFMTSIVSNNSKYDQYLKGEVSLSSDELSGKLLFEDKCANCHTPPLFTDYSFKNNGLDSTFPSDSGRARITGLYSDIGKFKVPSLRNVEYSGPYMHDGRFNTLEQVIDHYSSGIVYSHTLDTNNIPVSGFSLTANEKAQIVLFLKTLSDDTFINNEAYK